MNRQEIMNSAMKLSGAMKRTFRARGEAHAFPPAVERTLNAIKENEPLSSRELCDILDIRPSSASEMTARMEAAGLILRTASEDDKRVSMLSLTEGTRKLLEDNSAAREARIEEMTACFTDEEAELFCSLADKLSEHLKGFGCEEDHCCERPGHHGPKGCGQHDHHGPHGHCRRPGHHGPEGCGHHNHRRPAGFGPLK